MILYFQTLGYREPYSYDMSSEEWQRHYFGIGPSLCHPVNYSNTDIECYNTLKSKDNCNINNLQINFSRNETDQYLPL